MKKLFFAIAFLFSLSAAAQGLPKGYKPQNGMYAFLDSLKVGHNQKLDAYAILPWRQIDSVISARNGGTSGTYTPTLTSGTNIASSTSNIAHYIRVGNEVTVMGNIAITPTAGSNTQTVIDISLPIASNITLNTDCQGFGIAYLPSSALNEVGQFTTNSATHAATYSFYATSTSAFTLNYHFTYSVL